MRLDQLISSAAQAVSGRHKDAWAHAVCRCFRSPIGSRGTAWTRRSARREAKGCRRQWTGASPRRVALRRSRVGTRRGNAHRGRSACAARVRADAHRLIAHSDDADIDDPDTNAAPQTLGGSSGSTGGTGAATAGGDDDMDEDAPAAPPAEGEAVAKSFKCSVYGRARRRLRVQPRPSDLCRSARATQVRQDSSRLGDGAAARRADGPRRV